MTVNMHEAKTQLSRLVAAVLAGEEVILARGGKELVRLVALEQHAPKLRPMGIYADSTIDPDFERRSMEPLNEEELKSWGL
ncbi:type II toxin-antitoxin system Phd/YefM family antitoxin [Armatimonas sp.]|uniref:type II toxin-antitoxin system Phd/YefM family antitoxin n=1 Tax=Armatimonas sp. TaxID=1872638 RepID=UPI00375310A2